MFEKKKKKVIGRGFKLGIYSTPRLLQQHCRQISPFQQMHTFQTILIFLPHLNLIASKGI